MQNSNGKLAKAAFDRQLFCVHLMGFVSGGGTKTARERKEKTMDCAKPLNNAQIEMRYSENCRFKRKYRF
jgi:hypothetical protein